jgi:hypothetical protein
MPQIYAKTAPYVKGIIPKKDSFLGKGESGLEGLSPHRLAGQAQSSSFFRKKIVYFF